MRGGLIMLSVALGVPMVCGALFVAFFLTLVGHSLPQLPSWAREGVEAWMLGTPQPAGSDYHGEPGDGSDGVFTGGQVGFDGYAGPESFVCRIPAERGSVTDDYGVPRDPYPAHNGIDYGTCYQHDVAVITPMGGRVVFAGWNSDGYGNLLVIENDGWQVYLGHNGSFLIGVGDVVRAGEKVSLSGSTGNSSGPHVHFETRECIDGRCMPRNPEQVLLPGQLAYCGWSRLASTCGG